MGASVLRLQADDRVVWECQHRVVKPSEMIVADVLWKTIGSAQELAFTVAPAPDVSEGKIEPAAEMAE
jgi:hypothetical protein